MLGAKEPSWIPLRHKPATNLLAELDGLAPERIKTIPKNAWFVLINAPDGNLRQHAWLEMGREEPVVPLTEESRQWAR